jgi:hypothetical protein
MSCLEATFTLTPRSPFYLFGVDWGELFCYGADFYASSPYDFSSLYHADRFFFTTDTAADPNTDYTQWVNRMRVPFLIFGADLGGHAAGKQLALVFGFEAVNNGRVLVYTDAGKISDQTLAPSDNQFLLEIEVPSISFSL